MPAPDWRDPTPYAVLRDAQPAVFAWEWLRRDPLYAKEARSACQAPSPTGSIGLPVQPGARQWGLHRFEDPLRAAPMARPLWVDGGGTTSLRIIAAAPTGKNRFPLNSLRPLATLACNGVQHLLLSDGFRQLRMDVSGRRLMESPIELRFVIDGLAQAAEAVATIRRLVSICTSGRLSPRLFPPASRSDQRILELRVADALAAGASQRDMASRLIDPEAADPHWRERMPSQRLRIQRLVRAVHRRQQLIRTS